MASLLREAGHLATAQGGVLKPLFKLRKLALALGVPALAELEAALHTPLQTTKLPKFSTFSKTGADFLPLPLACSRVEHFLTTQQGSSSSSFNSPLQTKRSESEAQPGPSPSPYKLKKVEVLFAKRPVAKAKGSSSSSSSIPRRESPPLTILSPYVCDQATLTKYEALSERLKKRRVPLLQRVTAPGEPSPYASALTTLRQQSARSFSSRSPSLPSERAPRPAPLFAANYLKTRQNSAFRDQLKRRSEIMAPSRRPKPGGGGSLSLGGGGGRIKASIRKVIFSKRLAPHFN